ncbi:MAG: MFS transporter [Chloroflexi bacterium]|nr:MFS transporter [Chloroflexota bacterium]
MRAVIGTAPSAPSGGRFAALRSRNFRILWLGLFSSNAGAQVQLVAQAWLVLQMTDSALSLGILAASFAAPMIALPLFGGALADHFDRITILKVTQTAQVLLRGSLAGLVALGVADVATMYLFQFASAAILAFDNPPRQAILPGIVPRADLLSATSLMSVIWTGAQLVGPALGGWLLPIVGPAWLFAIGGATAFASLAATFALRDVPNRLERRPEPLAEHLFGGVRFAWAECVSHGPTAPRWRCSYSRPRSAALSAATTRSCRSSPATSGGLGRKRTVSLRPCPGSARWWVESRSRCSATSDARTSSPWGPAWRSAQHWGCTRASRPSPSAPRSWWSRGSPAPPSPPAWARSCSYARSARSAVVS